MVSAYILIEVPPPEDVKAVVEKIRLVKGVKAANAVAGPYDVIAEIEALDFNTVVNMVIQNIRTIEGITDTITLYVVS